MKTAYNEAIEFTSMSKITWSYKPFPKKQKPSIAGWKSDNSIS